MFSPFTCIRCGTVLPGNDPHAVTFPSGEMYLVCGECTAERPQNTTATPFDELEDETRDELIAQQSTRIVEGVLDDLFSNPPHKQ